MLSTYFLTGELRVDYRFGRLNPRPLSSLFFFVNRSTSTMDAPSTGDDAVGDVTCYNQIIRKRNKNE